MKKYIIKISNKEIEIIQDDDGKFIKPEFIAELDKSGSAIKPAHEPICMARKKLSEKTIVQNVLKWGTGAINIDGCRVGSETMNNAPAGNKEGGNSLNMSKVGMPQDANRTVNIGRFPANFIHDGSPEVTSLFPDTKASPSKGHFRKGNVVGDNRTPIGAGQFGDGNWVEGSSHNDSGSASRFFYCAKAGKKERNNGLEGFEEKEIRGGGGRVEDGYDITNEKQFNLKEAARKYGAVKTKKANIHPTVKPIKLMRYLCRLVTPKGGTVLDPFMGSGSTGISAKLENFDFIGIELDKEYCKIAEARINNFKL